MGPKKPDLSGYQYSALHSLVINTDRTNLPRVANEPTGEPETLVGRIDPKAMGSRVRRETIKDLDKKKKKAERADADESDRALRRRGADLGRTMGGYTDILQATADLEGLRYRPRTAETRQVYELMLSSVHQALGDQAQDVVRSATDTILEVLKTDALKDFDKKNEIEDIVGSLSSESFGQLLALSKKITDYEEEGEGAEKDPDAERKEGDLDQEGGVAVMFEDEEEEEESDGEGYVIRDESDEEDEEGGRGTREGEEDVPEEQDVERDELVIGTGAPSAAAQGVAKDGRLSAHEIDPFWLQRNISQHYPDAHEASAKTTEAMAILSSESNTRDVENALMELTDYDKFNLVQLLLRNRELIVWCTRLGRADADSRVDIEVTMREKGVGWILKELQGRAPGDAPAGGASKKGPVLGEDAMDVDQAKERARKLASRATVAPGTTVQPKRTVDLDSMAFSQGGHLMSNSKVKLPEGSFKRSMKGYEEIHVPNPQPPKTEDKLIPISELPFWAQKAFGTAPSLNRIQSRVYPVAFGKDVPILLCAPTGAGKTNVAMLTILNEMGKYRDEQTGEMDVSAFKIVYIAPMKALVAEQAANFRARLEPYGITVNELTGDSQLTKQQIAETQIIVTTPEKWDVISRKSTDTSYTNLVRLIIIDEIHLLHDDRGPVLESIVARTIRRMEQMGDYVRLVGLSATLPNYQDVATFLRVNPKEGLFYFDGSFRPCPLRQTFIGVTEKKAFKRYQVMNDVAYEKTVEQVEKGDAVITFVHSRKETAKTAKHIKDMAMEKETLTSFLPQSGASREILAEEAERATDPNLKELLPFGIGIHHAGLNRADRSVVEALFGDGHLRLIVATATLAWGVNLPAHCVIIKGTQIYNPEKGRWMELSPQDVLQMLGRAGRPQYDTFGEGVIITNHTELQYYLSLMNQQLPIESQFISKLADNLNAEIVQGTIRNRDEAVQWLGYTYLFVRMLRSPSLYGVGTDYQEDDPLLEQFRSDAVHTAAVLLEKTQLIKYQRQLGLFQSTELGRIASHYYIAHTSMATYNKHLKPYLSLVELFRVFALSDEFKYQTVRADEKNELQRLLERVPVPVRESSEEPIAKVNVLLQTYISNLKLEGFALAADMVYITQSAGRLLRALFEMAVKRGYARLARLTLSLCQSVERRQWSTMTPLRQFRLPQDLIRRLERKEFPFNRLLDLAPNELGELVGVPKAGRLLHETLHKFPKLELQAFVQPLTPSLLKVDVTITPDFQWDEKVHGTAQMFHLFVEDPDGEQLLFADTFVLRQQFSEDDHTMSFTVPLTDPQPPAYYISILSDRFLSSETRLPVSFMNLIVPAKFPPPTKLLDLQPLPVQSLANKEFEALYKDLTSFNKIQTQVFHALYQGDDNVLVAAPSGSGKMVAAEFALLRLWGSKKPGRSVLIVPYLSMVSQRVAEWRQKFGQVRGGKTISGLTGDTSADLRLLEESDVVVATPEQWDVLSRRWKQRKNVREVSLYLFDEVQQLGDSGSLGATYEMIVSRARYVAAQSKFPTRIVALSVSLANGVQLGEWIGASQQTTFNFEPSARPIPMEVHLQTFSIPHFPSLMLAMAKPTYLAIVEHASTEPVIAFVPSRKQAKLTANDLLSYVLADESEDRFLNIEKEDLQPHLDHLEDKDLAETLQYGIAYYHEALSRQDRRIVERLFQSGAIQLLVASKDTAWSMPMTAHMVIIMGVQSYEGKEHRYVDYPIADVLRMVGRSIQPGEDGNSRAVLMTQATRKDFYKKFLSEGLPLESHLPHYLYDHFNAEIVSRIIENKQDAVDLLTWTYMYRRMTSNPQFYNINGTTHRHLSDALSELVENTLNDLTNAKMISIEDEMDTTPLNLGMIAAYYNISYVTIDVFNMSLKERTKMKGLLEIVSSAAEFEDMPIRRHEDSLLRRIYDRVPVKLDKADFNSPYFKVFILLQAHFSRLALPADLAIDQTDVLRKVLNLLSASVDVMSSNAQLNAITAMELSQMAVQGVWERDSPLKQIPHFDKELISKAQEKGVESVFDFMELEDDDRNHVLAGLTQRQVRDVATFVNAFPSIEVSHELEEHEEGEGYASGTPITLNVTLSKEDEDEEEEESQDDGMAIAPLYPGKKMVNWWLVIGDPATKQLLGIKKVTVKRKIETRLDFTLPKVGEYALKLSLICDSYIGADQEFDLPVSVTVEGEESSDEESSEDEEDTEMKDAE